MAGYQCPHCGKVFADHCELIPNHITPPKATGYGTFFTQPCPGSLQHPRNPESDRRKLWSEETPAAEAQKAAEATQVKSFRELASAIARGGKVAGFVDGVAVVASDFIVCDDQAAPVTDTDVTTRNLEWWKTFNDSRPRECLPSRLHQDDLVKAISAAGFPRVESVDIVQVDADGTPVALSLGFDVLQLEPVGIEFDGAVKRIEEMKPATFHAMLNAGCLTLNEYRARYNLPPLDGPKGQEPYNPEPVNGIAPLPFTVEEAEAAGLYKPFGQPEEQRTNTRDIIERARYSGVLDVSLPAPIVHAPIEDDPQPFLRGPGTESK